MRLYVAYIDMYKSWVRYFGLCIVSEPHGSIYRALSFIQAIVWSFGGGATTVRESTGVGLAQYNQLDVDESAGWCR